MNYTFRTLPKAAQLEGWLAAVPEGFRFSFKAPQRITHFARLRACDDPLKELLEALEPARSAGKLGPLLFQLPPNFAANLDRLAAFLDSTCLREKDAPRIAFEFRHETWFDERVYALLRDANAALCVAESEDLKTPDVRTADFVYYRLRCPGGYKTAALKRLAAHARKQAEQGEIFVYLKHEDEPTGALNARELFSHAARANRGREAEAQG